MRTDRVRTLRARLAAWVAGKSPAASPTGGDYQAFDSWSATRAPSAEALVNSYRGTAYACANLCAQGVASVPLRLYVETRAGQAAPRCATRQPGAAAAKSLASRPALSNRLARAKRIDEVTEHPILDLLSRVNDELDGFSLVELTQLYMEVTGSAYWYLPTNALGAVEAIWVLEAQHVVTRRAPGGALEAYDYGWGPGRRTFKPAEILAFRMPSLKSPYHAGWSPLAAAYEAAALEEKSRAHAHTLFENSARPDVIVSARGDYGGLGEDEAERLERRFRRKFRRGRSGGVLVISDEVDVKPLTFSPRDLHNAVGARLTREEIANAFGVPVSMLQAHDVNRANAEAGHYQLARNALLPRCRRLEQRLSQRFCTLFDSRLFVAFDPVVPEDREYTLRERQAYLAAGVITPEELRREIGLEPRGTSGAGG